MKQEARTNRSLLVLLAMILAICLAMGITAKSAYASTDPILRTPNHDVVFLGYLSDDKTYIELENIPKRLVSVKWKVDKPSIATLERVGGNVISPAYVDPKKPGVINVTATITYKEDVFDETTGTFKGTVKKTYVAKKKIVIKKANGVKHIKIGSSTATLFNPGEEPNDALIFNNKKGKLKVSLNKGWKLSSATFKDGKTKKTVKNGSIINNKRNYSDLYLTIEDIKTKATYKAFVSVERYNTFKVTYGKMKKNTMLVYTPKGREPMLLGEYNKKAHASDLYSFKTCNDLTKKLKLQGYDPKRKGNIITMKLNKDLQLEWYNPGKGCKVKFIK